MNTLTFLSIKSIADNLDFKQTQELAQLLYKNLNKMKLVKIKEQLHEKFLKYPVLENYIPLIDKISIIWVDDSILIFELIDEEKQYTIYMGDDYSVNYSVNVFGTDGKPEKYLVNFGNILSGKSLIDEDDLVDGLADEGVDLLDDFDEVTGKIKYYLNIVNKNELIL